MYTRWKNDEFMLSSSVLKRKNKEIGCLINCLTDWLMNDWQIIWCSKYQSIILFGHADWLSRRWLAKYYSPPSGRKKTKWLLLVYCRVFIRSRQPANSGGYFRYQRCLLLLTFAIGTLKVYFFIWRLLTSHWSYKNKGTRKWKSLTLILGLIFCCGWF